MLNYSRNYVDFRPRGNDIAGDYSHSSEEKISVKDLTGDRLPIEYVVCLRKLGQVKLEAGQAISSESFQIRRSSDGELVSIASRVRTNPRMAQFHAVDGTLPQSKNQDACYEALP
jgi:hypothetical protein